MGERSKWVGCNEAESFRGSEAEPSSGGGDRRLDESTSGGGGVGE